MKKSIGVLALQGAFIEHEEMLSSLGAECFEIRNLNDLARPMDGLVLPGGESTVQGKLLAEEGLLLPLKEKIEAGLPVLATCAGMILLAKRIANDKCRGFSALPVTVERNAYGRQLSSFITTAEVKGLGPMRMNFIRAPFITEADPDVEILSVVNGHIIAVRYQNQIALSFHPEVGEDTRVHELFLSSIRDKG